tara:strand:- start:219 stop:1001 length:783 start_codon:yes stop_codon:yes gene_type:complete
MQIIRCRLINSEGITKGCEKAPVKILDSLKSIKSNEDGKAIDFEKLNLEEIHVDLENIEEANHLILENSKEAFEKNNKVFFIGGDHYITYSIGKAFNKIEENPLLIVFDAHADCRDSKGHDSWLRNLVESGFLGNKIILISPRNFLKQDIEYMKENNIVWIGMHVINEDIEEICDMIMERARKSSGFYLSIDIDCLDPAFAPGVSYSEPGGLTNRQLIYFIKRLKLLDNFRGADIVEVNPDMDSNNITVKLGAKLIAEMI